MGTEQVHALAAIFAKVPDQRDPRGAAPLVWRQSAIAARTFRPPRQFGGRSSEYPQSGHPTKLCTLSPVPCPLFPGFP